MSAPQLLDRCKQESPEDAEFIFWCPGCKVAHWFKTTGDHPRWTFDGNMECPTVSPSILVRYGDQPGDKICHLFIEGGQIKYQGDSTHEFSGKTIPMESLQ